jgi:hypothetical protein
VYRAFERVHSYRDFLFEHETDVHLAFYSAIGRVCVVWSNLEFQVDISTQSLYDVLGGNQLASSPPFSFDKKMDFWKDCFKNLPSLSDMTTATMPESIARLVSDLKKASNDRNILLHTHWGSLHDSEPPQTLSGNSISPKKGTYFMKGTKIEFQKIIDFTAHIDNLNGRVLGVTLVLSQVRNRTISEKSQRPPTSD